MRPIGFLLLVVLLPARAAAQTQIVVGGVLPSEDSSVYMAEDLVIDIDAPRLVRRLPAVVANGFIPVPPMRTTPDGAFAVNPYFRGAGRRTESAIGVHRIATGERWIVEGIFAGHLVANQRRNAMYFSDGSQAGVLDPAGTRWWQACTANDIGRGLSALAVARDGSALYVACYTTLLVLDPETGAERSRWHLERPPTSMHTVAGHRLLVLDWEETTGAPRHFTLYDLETGTLVVSVAVDRAAWVVASPAVDRILVGRWDGVTYASTPELWDAASLTVLAALPVNGVIEAAFTRDGRRLVLLRQVTSALHVAVVDAEANALVADVPVGFHHTFDIHGLAVVEPPLAPIGVFAEVIGQSVSLGWSLPQHSATATDYLIEVGPTPGAFAATASRSASLGTTLQVLDVPPGTYYVRIRGMNAAGVGPPSAIARVDVE